MQEPLREGSGLSPVCGLLVTRGTGRAAHKLPETGEGRVLPARGAALVPGGLCEPQEVAPVSHSAGAGSWHSAGVSRVAGVSGIHTVASQTQQALLWGQLSGRSQGASAGVRCVTSDSTRGKTSVRSRKEGPGLPGVDGRRAPCCLSHLPSAAEHAGCGSWPHTSCPGPSPAHLSSPTRALPPLLLCLATPS